MELRHLRYFTAVVQWRGYREASRHLYVAQPSISQAVADLESELGIKLFSREGRTSKLTPEGQIFYEEALKTLVQAERSITTAHRAANGEIGRLGIGFMGFTAHPFLSDLIRKYKTRILEWHCSWKKMCQADRIWRLIEARSTSHSHAHYPPTDAPTTRCACFLASR
jgi:DNA-binding transcriptional LysR family regulator